MTKYAKKNNKFWIIVCFVLTFALIFTMADFCSNLITIKAFKPLSNSATCAAYSIHLVVLKNFTDKNNAVEYSLTLQKQNGAGYIMENKNSYDVIASAYLEENDAKLVVENLKKDGHTPSIKKITIQPIIISGNYSQNETNTLSSAITAYKMVYENLYDISVALDTKIADENQSKLFISDIENLLSKEKLNFDALFANNLSTEILYIKLTLQNLYDEITELKNFSSSQNQTLSSKIKYTYIKTIELNKTLCEKLLKQ